MRRKSQQTVTCERTRKGQHSGCHTARCCEVSCFQATTCVLQYGLFSDTSSALLTPQRSPATDCDTPRTQVLLAESCQADITDLTPLVSMARASRYACPALSTPGRQQYGWTSQGQNQPAKTLQSHKVQGFCARVLTAEQAGEGGSTKSICRSETYTHRGVGGRKLR